MIAALLRYPRHLRRAKASEWGKRGAESRRKKAVEHGTDADTVLWRAKQDARGTILRHGVTYSAAHPDGQPWTILRAKHGRTNQVDLHVGLSLVFTGSLRKLVRGMKRARL